MGLRFRKSIKIAPGIRVNLSKSGVSVSAGKRGATVNVGKGGVTGTVGMPGTGLSMRKRLVGWRKGKSEGSNVKIGGLVPIVLFVIGFIVGWAYTGEILRACLCGIAFPLVAKTVFSIWGKISGPARNPDEL